MFNFFGNFESIIKNFYRFILENLLGLSTSTKLGSAFHFFLFDVTLILTMLFIIVYFVSLMRSLINPEKLKKLIENNNGIKAHILASLLGIFTPFCSCSSIPLFISFLEVGIPTGVVFSFLITSPMVNEAAFALLFSVFGIKIAILYTLAGITIGVLGGLVISRLKLEKYLADYLQSKFDNNQSLKNACCSCNCSSKKYSSSVILTKHRFALREAKSIVCSVWKYVILGIAVGAFIHGWVPSNSLELYLGSQNKFALLIAVLVGIPLYTDSITIIPLIEVLIQKGVGLGTALAFMMSAAALSLPEIILLKKVLKPKLIGIFVIITSIGIFIVGILFNSFYI